jgi:hypothetical protein
MARRFQLWPLGHAVLDQHSPAATLPHDMSTPDRSGFHQTGQGAVVDWFLLPCRHLAFSNESAMQIVVLRK